MYRYAAVEGGGTSWRVAIAEGDPTNIVERASFETKSPEETLGAIRDWLAAREYDSLGVATFGPVECHPDHPHYGYITTTPKPGWAQTDVLGAVMAKKVPVLFDTDVNAPAMAEFEDARNKKLVKSSCAYITVGTGVGIGLVINSKTVHGMMHPEGGHIMPARLPGDDFKGSCPFHGPCVEGLTATGALKDRKGLLSASELKSLSDDDPLWDYSAHALAQLCATLILTVSPERIVLSGGVMLRECLFPKIRASVVQILNGYIDHPMIKKIEQLIVPSVHGDNAGLIGALYLSKLAFEHKTDVS